MNTEIAIGDYVELINLPGYIARVASFHPLIDSGVVLDRKLDHSRYWNVDQLRKVGTVPQPATSTEGEG